MVSRTFSQSKSDSSPSSSHTNTSKLTHHSLSRLSSISQMLSHSTQYKITLIFLILSVSLVFTQAESSRFLGEPIPNKQPLSVKVRTGKPFTFHFPQNLFTDPDGDHLEYEAKLTDGSPLPDWIKFDAAALHMYGTAPHSEGVVSIMVTASDGNSEASVNFSIMITKAVLSLDIEKKNFVYVANKHFSLTLAIISTSNISLSEINSTATLVNNQPLPDWITYDPKSLRFEGISPLAQTIYIKVTLIVDEQQIQKQINIRFNPELYVKKQIPDQIFYLEGEPIAWTIPHDTFAGIQYTYTAKILGEEMEEDLPAFMTFFPFAGEFVINPHLDNLKPLTIKITATDDAEQTASTEFKITTRNVQYVMPKLVIKSLVNQKNFASLEPQLVSKLLNQGVFVTWLSNSARENSHISAMVFDNIGSTVIPEFHLNDYEGTADLSGPKVTLFANGNILVVWKNSNYGIRAKIIDQDMKVIRHEFTIQNDMEGVRDFNVWSFGENAVILIVQDRERSQCIGYMVGNNGTFIKKDFVIQESLESDITSPKLTQYNNETYIFSWLDRQTIPSKSKIQLKVIDMSFNTITNSTISTLRERLNNLETLVLANGNILIAWAGNVHNLPNQTKLFGIIVSGNLTEVKHKFEIASYKSRRPPPISLSFLTNGSILCQWDTILRNDGQASILDQEGNIINKRVIITNPKSPSMDQGWFLSLGVDHGMVFKSHRDHNHTNIWAELVVEKFTRNTVPDLTGIIPDQTMYQGDTFNLTFADHLFTDYDGEYLTITVALENGDPLPRWIHSHRWNKTITIDPMETVKGEYKLQVRAEDQSGAFVRTYFTLKVESHPIKFIVCLVILAFSVFMCGLFIWKQVHDNRIYNMLQIPSHRESAKSSEGLEPPLPLTGIDIETLISFNTDKIPQAYICPITGELMCDPYIVFTKEGTICHSYEKSALDKWFASNDTDPMTRLVKVSLGSNLGLKSAIELYLKNVPLEDITSDFGLYLEIEKWVSRRGKRKLLKDENLKVIVERYQEAKKIIKEKQQDKVKSLNDTDTDTSKSEAETTVSIEMQEQETRQ